MPIEQNLETNELITKPVEEEETLVAEVEEEKKQAPGTKLDYA